MQEELRSAAEKNQTAVEKQKASRPRCPKALVGE